MLIRVILPLLASSAVLVAAQTANLTSTGCVDASAFQSCQNEANEKLTSCIANADGDQEIILACGCVNYVSNYNCYAASCWNRVWECEYQAYMVSYLRGCPTAKFPMPYFPAPNDAPDSCSCNLGLVYMGISDSILETATCTNNANSGDAFSNVQKDQGCMCCEISGAVSTLFNICPKTNPALIGLSEIQQLETTADTNFNDCGQYLDTYNCQSDLSYTLTGVSTFYAPTNLPQSGTETLMNNAGTVTAAPSGPTFTYTNGGDKVVYTITAAKDNGKGKGGGSGSSPGGGSGSGGSGGSGSGGSGSGGGSSGSGGSGSGGSGNGSGGSSGSSSGGSSGGSSKSAADTLRVGGALSAVLAFAVTVLFL